MSLKRSKDAGFTLIEVLIVVLVVGIVASIAVVNYFTALDKSKQRATMADMRSVARALEAYLLDNHFVPDDSGGMATLEAILIPYQISVVPTRDHWGNSYHFESDNFDDYSLESYGKDGAPGADISYPTRNDFYLDIVMSNGIFLAAPE
jgi:general secretion pathway protein G